MSIKDESKKLKSAVLESTISYFVAALSVVAGLAWNDAIASTIDVVFPGDASSIIAKFTYAIFITILVVLLTVGIKRLMKKDE